MQKLYKLRFLPLILGAISLLIELVVMILFPQIKISILYSGIGITVLGIIFLQAMRQLKREELEEKNEPKQSESEKEQEIIKTAEYQLKNGLAFLFVRAFLSILLVGGSIGIITNGQWKLGIILCIVGILALFLHICWINANLTSLRSIKQHKNEQENKIWSEVKEIKMENLGNENLVIRVFDNGTSCLIFEFFPPLIKKLTDEQTDHFDAVLSEVTGVKVVQDDRGIFVINSNQDEVINKVIEFLNTLKVLSYANLIELTKILTNNDEAAISDMTMIAKDKNKFCENHKKWCEDFANDELLIFAYWLVGYDTNCKFGAYIDWKEEIAEIWSQLEIVIRNLKYPLNLDKIEFKGKESTEEVLKIINNHFVEQGYTLITLDTKSDSYHLFITKLENVGRIDDLGCEIGFYFSNNY